MLNSIYVPIEEAKNFLKYQFKSKFKKNILFAVSLPCEKKLKAKELLGPLHTRL